MIQSLMELFNRHCINNFKTGLYRRGTNNLDELLFNCAGEVSTGDTQKLVDFVRGYDSYGEDPGVV